MFSLMASEKSVIKLCFNGLYQRMCSQI